MKRIGVILNKPKFNTAVVFIKELRTKGKQKINYFKIKKLLVETNSFNVGIGNLVEIKQTRPLSKTKNFIITRILLN
jgi:ribosomal protein S17